MFLRFRRRMLAYIVFSAIFIITFFALAGEDLQVKKHYDYVVDKAKGQWDFDPKSGGIKPEDAVLKNKPNDGIPGKTETAPVLAAVQTENAVKHEAAATNAPATGTKITGPNVPAPGPTDPGFVPAPKVVVGEKPTKEGTDAYFKPEHWVKQAEKYPVSPDKLIKLPTGAPEQFPMIQATFGPETDMQKQTRKNRQAKVKEEFRHAWKGYKAQAWTHDEVRPISGGVKDPFCGWAATMVDALDTMWIMGLTQEFEEAVEQIAVIDFTTTPREQIPMFETTIRYLGGMLAAYDVSGGNYLILLEKAKELAEILMGAFDTPNHMPVLYYSWKPVFAMQAKRAGSRANFAELSSLVMEFTRLAQLTGEDRYYDAVARITDELVEWQKRGTKLKGVFPDNVDAQGCNKSASLISAQSAAADGSKFLEEPDSNVYNAAAPVGGGPSNPMNVVAKRSGLSEHATPVMKDASKDWDCEPQGLTGELTGRESFSMGGGQDSGYEYFLKMHLLLGGLEPKYKQLYKGTIEAIKTYMLWRPMIPDENRSILFTNKLSTFGHPEQPDDLQITYEITHLTCFIGGMVGMGAQIFKEPEELSIAEKLSDGCVYAYSATKSGIMPETARGVPCDDPTSCPWDEKLWYRYLDPMSPQERARDGEIWDKKNTEKQKKLEEEAALKKIEAAESQEESQENLDKDRAKLDMSFAAYAYRKKPGTQPKMSAEEMMKIDESVSKYATLSKENGSVAGMAKDATIAAARFKGGEKKPVLPIDPKLLADPEALKKAIIEGLPDRVDKGVVANPDGHAADPADAVAVEDKYSKKVKREAANPSIPKPKLTGTLLPPPSEGSTVKSGAQTQGNAKPAVEADSMVDGAPPALPKLNPEDRIDVDAPRPLTHEQYVMERIAREKMPRGFAGIDSTAYILRPEAIESVWYMHRITADPKWADKGWDMFAAIIRATKSQYGHSAIHDVNAAPTQKVDSMESFWLAETLKYFYLLYSDPDLISLDEWVLNTEAHPFRRPTMATYKDNAARIEKWEEFEKSKQHAVMEVAKAKKEQEEQLKRQKEIDSAKAAGAGRGGVAAKVVALPDTPVDPAAAESKRKQDEYLRVLGEQEAAAKKAQEDEYLRKIGEQEAAAKAGGADAMPAPLPVVPAPAPPPPAAPVDPKLAEALKALEDLNELQNGIPGGGVRKPAVAAPVGADPAAPAIVNPAPVAVPVAPAPVHPAAAEGLINPVDPATMDLEAYAAKAKADAYAAKLAALEKFEKDIAEGKLTPEEAGRIGKELKAMRSGPAPAAPVVAAPAAPAAPAVVNPAPIAAPAAPAPVQPAADAEPIVALDPAMDLEAYAAKMKADAYATKLAKLEKFEKDVMEGNLTPEEAAAIGKELKEMK